MRQFNQDEILMAEKAEEIQKGWQPDVGDYFLHDYHGTTKFNCELEDKLWPDKEQWEQIECLTYKPAIDDFIEVSTAAGEHGTYTSSGLLKDRHIWLPLEHQLWEMAGGYKPKIFLSFVEFVIGCSYLECWGDFPSAWDKYTSMWQLLLAFVMHELYQKVWDSDKKEWVKV
jgi:hypothetical protein